MEHPTKSLTVEEAFDFHTAKHPNAILNIGTELIVCESGCNFLNGSISKKRVTFRKNAMREPSKAEFEEPSGSEEEEEVQEVDLEDTLILPSSAQEQEEDEGEPSVVLLGAPMPDVTFTERQYVDTRQEQEDLNATVSDSPIPLPARNIIPPTTYTVTTYRCKRKRVEETGFDQQGVILKKSRIVHDYYKILD